MALLLAGSAAQAGPRKERAERRVASWVNALRLEAGRSWLRRSWPLDAMADHHSGHMGANYRLSQPDGGPSVVGAAAPGELGALLRGWRRSELRTRLLAASRNRMGVGIEKVYGFLWVTVLLRG